MKRLLIATCVALSACATATKISADVAVGCAWAAPALPAILAVAPSSAPGLASVQAVCTANGMLEATLKDQAPVTPTNSGSTKNWIISTLAALAAQYGVVLPAQPPSG